MTTRTHTQNPRDAQDAAEGRPAISPIRTAEAPPPAASYEQAIVTEHAIYVSGQVAIDPATQAKLDGPLEAQVACALANIEAILRAAGANRRHIVKCGVFLADLADFAAMDQAFRTFFGDARPARTTVQAGLGAWRVEIDAIAVRPRVAPTA